MNLNTEIDFDIKRFLHWWGRELILCLPERARQLFSNNSGQILLTATEQQLSFAHLQDEQLCPLASLTLDSNSAEAYQRLIDQHAELQHADYILRLTPGQAIKKILYLPTAAKENLQQVVAFEIDRLTPFKQEQVYFAVKLVAKEADKIKVLLVLSPKEVLDSMYEQLNGLAIQPQIADFSEAPNNYADELYPYNLLPEWARPKVSKTTQITSWGLGLLTLILLAAVLVFPLWRQGQVVEELRQQLHGLEAESRLVQAQQLEIDELVSETERLIEVKQNAPQATELLNVLTELMPDGTWLTHLKLNNQRMQIQGQSAVASGLISVIESSGLFINARFVSPLTQDKRTGMERFQISMEVSSIEETADE